MFWYSTWSWNHGIDISTLSVRDVGDVPDPDYAEGEQRVFDAMRDLRGTQDLLVALGGDNAITYSVAKGLWGDDIGACGLVTVDAHHDLRDGISNGSPVRRLVEEAADQGDAFVRVGALDERLGLLRRRQLAGQVQTGATDEHRVGAEDRLDAQCLQLPKHDSIDPVHRLGRIRTLHKARHLSGGDQTVKRGLGLLQRLGDDDGDGIIEFSDLAAGDHTLSEISAPEGYVAAADQTVTVNAGEVAADAAVRIGVDRAIPERREQDGGIA